MNPLACLLALALVALPASAEPAAANAHRRGWLSGVGIGLIGSSLVAGALGLNFQLSADATNRRLAGYYPAPNIAPDVAEASTVRTLVAQRDLSLALAAPLFVASAVALAGGVTCLVLDRDRGATLQVGVGAGPSAASVWVSGRF